MKFCLTMTCALALGAGAASSSAAQSSMLAGGEPYTLHVTTYRDMPFKSVVRQQFDYSCGSAALATLLRYHYGRPKTEADIFRAMYAIGDQAKIRRLGFSLLDMKKYLQSIDMPADGYSLKYAQLLQLSTPSIAVINVGRYKHFVVIKGTLADHVLVGDPALGLKSYSEAQFTKVWTGVVFAIHDGPDRHGLYNNRVEWSRWVTAPAGMPLDADSLGSITMQTPPVYQVMQFLPLTPIGR